MNDLYLVNKQYVLNKSLLGDARYISTYFNIVFVKMLFSKIDAIHVYCTNSTRMFTIGVKTYGISQETLNSVKVQLLEIIQKESLFLDENNMKNPLKEIFAKELLFI